MHVLALLCGRVCPVAGGGRIPVMGRWGGGGCIPCLFQCVVLSLNDDPVRMVICTEVPTGCRKIVVADAWSGRSVCT